MRTQGLGALAPQPFRPSGQLGKEQRISFLSMELDLDDQIARLTQDRAQLVLNCLNTFMGSTVVPLNQFQRLLGNMEAAAAVRPLGLLHMRPLQHWPHGRVPRCALQRGTGSESHRSDSPRGHTFHFFGECPWNRFPGMLWFTQMPQPPAGGPRSTGLQSLGLDGSPTALAQSCWQYTWP